MKSIFCLPIAFLGVIKKNENYLFHFNCILMFLNVKVA